MDQAKYKCSVYCRWNETNLHFKINETRIEQRASFTRIQYSFERENFDSIPALIMHHVGKNIPISIQTGAIIRKPINRELPLSYSDVRYASLRRSANPNGNPSIVPSELSSMQSRYSLERNASMQNYPFSFNESVSRRIESPTSKHETKPLPVSPQPFPLQLPVTGSKSSTTEQLNLNSPTTNLPNHRNKAGEDQLTPLPTQLQKSSSNLPPSKPSRVPSFRRPIIRHTSSKASKTKPSKEDENKYQSSVRSNTR